MPKHISATLLAGVLVAILAFHLAVAWQSVPTLARNGFLYDDSFYAFKIAQNIVAGRGVTFDGIHATSGFQPLYIFLLVPIYLISGGSPTLPIYIALSLLSVCTCLTAYLIFSIARRYVGRTASFLTAVIWAFSPIVTKQTANGLETALAVLMIGLSVYYYLVKIRPAADPSAGCYFKLGLLLGLTVLARIDGILLVLVVALDHLLELRRRGVASHHLIRASWLPLGVLVCYGPWLVFSMLQSGTPLQDSGSATRFLSLAYASYFGDGTESLAAKGPDLGFIWAQVSHSISTLKVIPPVHVLFRGLERIGDLAGRQTMFKILGDGFGLLLLAGIAWQAIVWRKDRTRSRRSELNFLLLFALLLLFSYSLYVFGAFFFLRYYFPVYLVACIFFAFLIQDVIDWLGLRTVRVRRLVLAGAVVYTGLFSFFSYSQAFRTRPVYPFYDIARWVDANTGADDKIGVFQCGAIAYFSNRQVINLDGKVNSEAFAALQNHTLDQYIQHEGIDVVIDHVEVLKIFLGLSSRQLERCCTKIPTPTTTRPTHWVAISRAALIRHACNGAAASFLAPIGGKPTGPAIHSVE
jgi:hypothetical protein